MVDQNHLHDRHHRVRRDHHLCCSHLDLYYLDRMTKLAVIGRIQLDKKTYIIESATIMMSAVEIIESAVRVAPII